VCCDYDYLALKDLISDIIPVVTIPVHVFIHPEFTASLCELYQDRSSEPIPLSPDRLYMPITSGIPGFKEFETIDVIKLQELLSRSARTGVTLA